MATMSHGSARRPGSPDSQVLDQAARERRTLLTFDKDFGELAWARPAAAPPGIVLLRMPLPPRGEVGPRLSAILSLRDDWDGHFSVVEPGRIRMRPMPLRDR